MYSLLISLHSYTRWLVVLFAVLAIVRAFVGWFGKRSWTSQDNLAGLLYANIMSLQIVLGLLLYVGISPMMQQIFSNFGAAMGDRVLRFWAVEHIFAMIVALALAHIGRARSRRAQDDVTKHRTAAIFFTISLIVMLLAIPWPWSGAPRPLFRGF